MCVVELGIDALNRGAQKSANKAQQAEMNRLTGMQAGEFDRRMGYARDSDGRTDTLLDAQYGDLSGLEDRTFAEMLAQNSGGFDDQVGINRGAFDTRMLEDAGLVTANRRIRLEQNAISDAERGRQQGFQADADSLAAALPALIGFAAQQSGAANATASRAALADQTMTGPVATPKGLDSVTAGLMARENARGSAEARTDARSAADFAGRGDAFAGAERQLGSFADSLSSMTQRAQLSRASLGDELAVGATERGQVGDRRDFNVGLADQVADQRSRTESDYRGAMGTAISGNADKLGDALGRFFDRSLGSEGGYTDNMVGSSSRFENTRLNLGNYKMGKTTAYSPLGNMLGIVNSAAKEAAAASRGG